MTGLFKRFVMLGVAALLGASSLPAQESHTRGAVTFAVPSETPGAKLETLRLYAKSYALVIGVDSYNDREWRRLKEARNDADAVARTLQAHGFKVTLHKDLKSSDLKREVEHFLITTGNDPEARLFIWFAGHGHTLRNGPSQEGFLVPADAPGPGTDDQPNPAFELAALPMSNFNFWMTRSRAKHVLAVFDSCFSGLALAITRSNDMQAPALISRETAGKARQIISSGDVDQQVADNGRFREIFINAITGKAGIGSRGYLTGRELGTHLRQEMVRVTANSAYKQRPNDGYVDRAGFRDGDFVFEVIRPDGTRVAPPPVETPPALTKAPRLRPAGPDPSTEARLAWERAERSNDRGQIGAWRRQFGAANPFYDQLAAASIAKLDADAKVKSDVAAKEQAPVKTPPIAAATPVASAVMQAPPPAKTAPASPVAPSMADDARAIELCRRYVRDPLEQAIQAWVTGAVAKSGTAARQTMLHFVLAADHVAQISAGCAALARGMPEGPDRSDALLLAVAASQLRSLIDPTQDEITEATGRDGIMALRRVVQPMADGGHANSRAAVALMDYIIAKDFSPSARLAFASRLSDSTSPWGRVAAALIRLHEQRDTTPLTLQDIAELKEVSATASPSLAAGIATFLYGVGRTDINLRAEAETLLKNSKERSFHGLLADAVIQMEIENNQEAAVQILRAIADKGGVIENLALIAWLTSPDAPNGLWKPLLETEPNLISSALDKVAASTEPAHTLFAFMAATTNDAMKALVGTGRLSAWQRRIADGRDAATLLSVADSLTGDAVVGKNEPEANRLIKRAMQHTRDPILLYFAATITTDNADKAALTKRLAEEANPAMLVHLAGLTPAKPNDLDPNAFDAKERAALLRRAAEAGDAEIGLKIIKQFTLAHLGGGDIEAGKIEQRRILSASAAKGTTEQILKVAEVLVSGEDGIVRDPLEAARLFKIVGEKTSDKKVQLDIARRFALGRDIAPNRDEASRLYRSAADVNDPEVALEVALAFGKGEGVYANPAEAAKWLKVAATSKVSLTLIAVADAYADGKLVPKDEAAAKRALQAAGEAGSALQKLVIARQFLSGAVKDETEGLKFLRAAADLGQADALEQLADMTERGVLVAADSVRAAALSLKSAKAKQRVADGTFETWRTTYSAEFRRAMQASLKATKHYTGAVDGIFGAGMKRALEAYAQ